MFSPPCWAPPRAAVARVLLAPPGPPRHLSQHACSCFPYHKEQNQQRLRRKNSVRGLPAGEEGQPEALPQRKASQGDAGRKARLLKGLHQQPFHRLQILGRLGFIFLQTESFQQTLLLEAAAPTQATHSPLGHLPGLSDLHL